MLQNISSEEFGKKWYFKTKYDNRLYAAYKSAYRRATKHRSEGSLSVGMYDFEYVVKIGLGDHLYQKDIDCKIVIKTPDRMPKHLWATDWNVIELNGSEYDIEKVVRTHLEKYFYSNGIISVIQWQRNCSKEDALMWLKMLVKAKKFHTFGTMDEDKFRKWIKKHCNITTYVGISDTARIAKRIGKQAEPLEILSLDFSFAENFDGDIDELETEFYEKNPISKNIIYV